jgi:hypothetical protein
MAPLPIALIVAGCALLQSIFGVGLLVFGTPLLLLLGVPFPTILIDLLPCSMAINLLQVLSAPQEPSRFRRDVLVFCLPAVALGLSLTLGLGVKLNLRPLVGGMLLLTVGLRLFGQRLGWWRALQRRSAAPLLVAIGFLHGLTNLGGGPLTAVVSSRFSDKREVRSHIAFGYLLMAAAQLVVLALSRAAHPTIAQIYLPAIAVAVYLLVGNRLFQSSTQRVYQHSMTGLLALVAALLFR